MQVTQIKEEILFIHQRSSTYDLGFDDDLKSTDVVTKKTKTEEDFDREEILEEDEDDDADTPFVFGL